MSIQSIFDPGAAERERKKKEEALAASMAQISASFGITTDELVSFLRDGIEKKRLRGTEKTIATMNSTGNRV